MTRAYAQLLAVLTVLNGRFEDRRDRGATAVEYGLLVGLIAAVIITVVGTIGQDLLTKFNVVANGL